MKNNLILFLILIFALSCKTEVKEKVEIETKELKSVVEKPIVKKQIDSIESTPKEVEKIENKNNENWAHSEYFKPLFKNYREYKVTDTINIDLNGNGILEQVYFDNKNCPKLLIIEKGQKTISIGCGKEDYEGFPNAVGWIDLWCVVYDKKVVETIIKDGRILRDETVSIERPSIFIGKEEAGGGIITYRNGKLYMIN